LDVIIKQNYEELSLAAAQIIARQIQQKPNSVLGLATGATPIGTYQQLIQMHRQGLDFSQVVTFNLDEYLGIGMQLDVPYAQDQSYARFMHEELFKHINIKHENIHIPDGLSKDPAEHCAWYEQRIKLFGGIDLQLLGIGGDGHWAFNEPGSSLGSRTRVQALTAQTLDDNYEAFCKCSGMQRCDMPHFAITMGVGTILEAKNLLMIVNGAKKAQIVAKALEGPVTSQVTASAIQLHTGGITVVLDEAAASCLAHAEHYKHTANLKQQNGW
jgi:glucosamine-6-phosphate deaminase